MATTYVNGFHDKEQMDKMRYSPLGNTDMQVSVIGFGGSPLGNVYDADLSEDQGVAAVQRALSLGVNYIDTAPYYGHGKSEVVLGKALQSVPREAYYIGTKVRRYKQDEFDFSAERVTQSVDESLQRLGLDYVDLIQVHDVEFAPSEDLIINETLPALEKVRQAGKTRFIGITGYPINVLRSIAEKSTVNIDTVLSYCHLSLNDSSLLQHVPFFKERNIGLISASPLSMALLTNRGPSPWHPANEEIKQACREAADYCRQANCDISEVALKYSVSTEVPLTLIGMESKEQVDNNLKAVNDGLSDEQEQFTKDLIHRFFSPLKKQDWEGEEVNRYREKLAMISK